MNYLNFNDHRYCFVANLNQILKKHYRVLQTVHLSLYQTSKINDSCIIIINISLFFIF